MTQSSKLAQSDKNSTWKSLLLLATAVNILLASYLTTAFYQFSNGFKAGTDSMSTQFTTFSGGATDYKFLSDYYFAIFVMTSIVGAVILIRLNYLTGILSLSLICYTFFEAFRVFSLKRGITTSEVYSDAKYFDIVRDTTIFDVVGLISLGILSLLLICYIFIQFRGVVDSTRRPTNSIISDVK